MQNCTNFRHPTDEQLQHRYIFFATTGTIICSLSTLNRTEHSTVQGVILQTDKFLKFDWLRPVVFEPNLKYLHVKNYAIYIKWEISLPCSINRKRHGFFGVFGIIPAHDISKLPKYHLPPRWLGIFW